MEWISLNNGGKMNGKIICVNAAIHKVLLENNTITKEEYASSQLLPIKFGAVSLAAKTGAKIVPCAVTGKYTFKDNHLNLRFGTPFKVENITALEEYRKKLEEEIINLKLEGLEDIKNNRI